MTASILEGRGAQMPAFRGRLSDQQVKELVSFLRSLAPTRAKPSEDSRRDDFEIQFRKLQTELDDLQKQFRRLQLNGSPRVVPAAVEPRGASGPSAGRVPGLIAPRSNPS